MRDASYAVHTEGCTFLLDEGGVCHSLRSRVGAVSAEARACIGAQFVASLHPDLDGCLAGELLVGASALFVRVEPATGRLILLRSGSVLRVDSRHSFGAVADTRLADDALDLSHSQSAYPPAAVSSRGGDTMPPPPVLSPSRGPMVEEITRTLTIPLYDADSAPLLPPRR